MKLGKQLRAMREHKGMTLTEFSSALGIDRAQVCRYEADTHQPNMPRLVQIAEALGTTVCLILEGASDA